MVKQTTGGEEGVLFLVDNTPLDTSSKDSEYAICSYAHDLARENERNTEPGDK